MAVTGTVYSLVRKDNSAYAYVDMGWPSFKTDHARKSGMCESLDGVPKLMAKMQRAVQKQLFFTQKNLDEARRQKPAHHVHTRIAMLEAEIVEFQNIEFGVVKITVEEVDPSMY